MKTGFRRLGYSFLFLLTLSAQAQECDLSLARVKYGGGGDWYTDPSSLPNLIQAIIKRTSITICPQEKQIPLLSEELYRYPILYMTGHGNIRFTDSEAASLRAYLLAGGFLIADDCYGMDGSFRREMKRVFPEFSFFEIPFSHPVYHSFYDFPSGLPKIHEHDGLPAQAFGLEYKGRLMVFYSFSSDLGDGWEDPEVHNDPPGKREAALQMGINIIVFALTGTSHPGKNVNSNEKSVPGSFPKKNGSEIRSPSESELRP